MKVRYTGNGYNLNNNDIYEVEESNQFEYQIRNDNGKLAWYVKTNFIEVKQKVKVGANPTNTISPDLVNKIEKELKDTEQRMADLRKQLEDAKLPPTNNILLREYDRMATNYDKLRMAVIGDVLPEMSDGYTLLRTDWKVEER